MNSIQNQPMTAGMTPGYSSLSDAQVSSYIRKQSVSTYESMNAALTIQTKDGDVVTLSSNTYSQMDAFMYDSKGVVQTEDGIIISSQTQREITLSSGDSFTFTVEGNLSDEELEDIEAIIKGIDGIVAQMAEGDMDEAIEKALAMGTYDTVSMYSADINYEKTSSSVIETQATAINTTQKDEVLPENRHRGLTGLQPFLENHAPKKRDSHFISDITKLFERMTEQLEKHEDKQIARSKKAINKLFNHHLKGEPKGNGEEISTFKAIENIQKQMNEFIDKITNQLFESSFSLF